MCCLFDRLLSGEVKRWIKSKALIGSGFLMYLLAYAADTHIERASHLEQKTESALQYDAISPAAARHGTGKWVHGGFIYIGMDADNPSVYTFDGDGGLIAGYPFRIPDANRIQIDGFDRAADGSVALCGVSYSSNGRAAYFIARVSADGQDSRLIRTNPYWPFLVSIAPDGTVWTVGVEQLTFPDGSKAGTNPSGNALRHYDKLGKLIFSTGPKSTFEPLRLTSGFLIAAKDRVAWYSPESGKGTYVEFSLDGRNPRVYPGAPESPEGTERVTGFAYTETGAVCLTLDTLRPRARTLLQLDRARRQWVPMDIAHPGVPFGPRLWGSDGNLLVFSGRSAEPNQTTAKFFAIVSEP